MGNACCQETNKEGLIFQVSDVPHASEYAVADWPAGDDFLQEQLASSAIGGKNIQDKPHKHKVYDRWYWGEWINGQPHGKGILYERGYYKDIYYEGDFNREPDGRGKVIFNKGESIYEGEIRKSRAEGRGKFVNYKDGSTFQGQWKDSNPYIGVLRLEQLSDVEGMKVAAVTTININEQQGNNQIIYPDGRVYRGEIDKNRFVPNGHGKVIFNNKSSYTGDWEQGQMHGRGKFEWPDGSSYEGDYLFGKKHGNGRFLFISGNYYEGFWADGKQNGRGILFSKDSSELKNGYWKDGAYVGTSKPEHN